MTIKEDATTIIRESVQSVLPGSNVKKVLETLPLSNGNIIVLSVGKAGYTMAKAAYEVLGSRITEGLVITKYNHMKASIPGFDSIEAGHPTPDENSFKAADKAIELVSNLSRNDQVIFLMSGGASALFEKPMIPFPELQGLTKALLSSGADITEINTVRKHLSYVKGGRFAELCAPAHVDTIVLSDVLGNDLSMVGSGPTAPDRTTGQDAFRILEKYHIKVKGDTVALLTKETPKKLDNVSFYSVGDVRTLCETAKKAAEKLGYKSIILTDSLECEAKDAGSFFASIAKTNQNTLENLAFIAGGETVVHLTGKGKGGRNQEMALSCGNNIAGLNNVGFFSVGSDGTDGPTDAAGGFVSGDTRQKLKNAGINPDYSLSNNDAYNALKAVGSLILTGPTGTNVNDVSVLLIRKKL